MALGMTCAHITCVLSAFVIGKAGFFFHEGVVCGSPRPIIEGMGFRRAFACCRRGTPCMARGSFIRVGSSLAGTVNAGQFMARSYHGRGQHTSAHDLPIVAGEASIRRRCGSRAPQMIRCVGKEVGARFVEDRRASTVFL